LTLLLGLLVNAVVPPLDQIHLRFFLPAVQFSAKSKNECEWRGNFQTCV
jgi:hypothetical protein